PALAVVVHHCAGARVPWADGPPSLHGLAGGVKIGRFTGAHRPTGVVRSTRKVCVLRVSTNIGIFLRRRRRKYWHQRLRAHPPPNLDPEAAIGLINPARKAISTFDSP